MLGKQKALLRAIRNRIRSDWDKQQIAKLCKRAKNISKSSDTILFWVPGGMSLMLHVEGALAVALKLRGYSVHAVICDGPFGACVKREVDQAIPIENWADACEACKADNAAMLEKLGIDHSFIGDYVPENVRSTLRTLSESVTWESLDALSYNDINVGKNVRSSVIRYLKGKSYARQEAVVREYGYSGLISAAAAMSAVDRIKPSRVFMSHGTYVDWGPALQVAHARGIPIMAWMASYLKAHFYLCHVDDLIRVDFHNLSDAAWEICKGLELKPFQNARLDKFLIDRYQKQIGFDMKQLQAYTGNTATLRKKYGLVDNMPVWGVISHINWDAVSDYAPMAYDNFDDWMLATVKEVIDIKDVQWLIKIHPAEAWDNPDSGVQRLIQENFPVLPPHVKVISAEDDISPLDFFSLVDGGITVYGTAGLELALHGKPVILGGEAHYGGKGFTHDGTSPEAYTQLLRKAVSLGPLDEEQQRLARNYAYCYFIQRQIPLRVVEDPTTEWWKFQFDKSHLLLAGEDPFVDFICDRIVDGRDFVMDNELVRLAELPDDDCGATVDENAVLSVKSLETVEGK